MAMSLGEALGAAVGAYRDKRTEDCAAALVRIVTIMRDMEDALRKAEEFIVNGVEFGYIKLPTTPDPALDTLPAIRSALGGVR